MEVVFFASQSPFLIFVADDESNDMIGDGEGVVVSWISKCEGMEGAVASESNSLKAFELFGCNLKR